MGQAVHTNSFPLSQPDGHYIYLLIHTTDTQNLTGLSVVSPGKVPQPNDPTQSPIPQVSVFEVVSNAPNISAFDMSAQYDLFMRGWGVCEE